MSVTSISALARLTEQRFEDFSQAAGQVLSFLAEHLPEGKVLVGQLDYGEGLCRVIESRGSGVSGLGAGAILPLPGAASRGGGSASAANGGSASANWAPDPEFLRLMSIRSTVAIPLEMRDGSRVGSLCAAGASPDLYSAHDRDLLSVAGRLLAHEWEAVMWRAQVQRLVEQLRDPEASDPVTGLADRVRFLETTERERHLAHRGVAESHVVVVRLDDLESVTERLGEPMRQLLLKDVAEVLAGSIRRTDHAGRVGDEELAATLVGCKGTEGTAAFCERVEAAVGRALQARPASSTVSFGVQALGATSSSAEALAMASSKAVGLAREARA